MSEIQKLASDDSSKQIEFSGNENHLFFRIDKRLLLSRKLTGNFPDYERVLPKEHPHTVVVAARRVESRHRARGAIRRRAFAGHSGTSRQRRIEGPFLDFRNGGKRREIPIEYSGPEVEIGFNAQYMLDFLRAVEQGEVEFHFKDSNSAGELRPHGAGRGHRLPLRGHADAHLSERSKKTYGYKVTSQRELRFKQYQGLGRPGGGSAASRHVHRLHR